MRSPVFTRRKETLTRQIYSSPATVRLPPNTMVCCTYTEQSSSCAPTNRSHAVLRLLLFYIFFIFESYRLLLPRINRIRREVLDLGCASHKSSCLHWSGYLRDQARIGPQKPFSSFLILFVLLVSIIPMLSQNLSSHIPLPVVFLPFPLPGGSHNHLRAPPPPHTQLATLGLGSSRIPKLSTEEL